MIAVIAKESQRRTVEEFFELFKIPWEYYEEGKKYDVVLVTANITKLPAARLIIIATVELTCFDTQNGICTAPRPGNVLLKFGDKQFPIYWSYVTFGCQHESFIEGMDKKKIGIRYSWNGRPVLRLGFDLFDEIAFLISEGQPAECATTPTLEVHISILRYCILEAGMPLVEIPPVPSGYNFIVCLTHDVDFMDIRSHGFDHSVVGFIVRALCPRRLRDADSHITFSRLMRNWTALLRLPGVCLGLAKDIWFDIDRYMDIEKSKNTTYFFIPFKDQPGHPSDMNPQPYRAAHYDVNDYKDIIGILIHEGHEVALHGIDAWTSTEKGREERGIISKITDNDSFGIRMHWLYFSDISPRVLEEAGFLYDSTIGYNDAVGYRAGTSQAYCLPASFAFYELPLHIMDTALFTSGRMDITEKDALRLCEGMISDFRIYGGALTVNWHTRSLSPERNWDDFYMRFVSMLEAENVWFANARQTVEWFKKRRSIRFEDVQIEVERIRVKLSSNAYLNGPGVCVRIHYPLAGSKLGKLPGTCERTFVDISCNPGEEVKHELTSVPSVV